MNAKDTEAAIEETAIALYCEAEKNGNEFEVSSQSFRAAGIALEFGPILDEAIRFLGICGYVVVRYRGATPTLLLNREPRPWEERNLPPWDMRKRLDEHKPPQDAWVEALEYELAALT